jgi:hypothetical protein
MSIRGKVVAAAAVMTLAGGVSAAGTLTAQAATPSCFQHCIDLFSQKFGPSFILDVLLQRGRAGQPVTLYQASNEDAGEEFTIVFSAVASHYGGTCSRVSSVTHKCVSHYPNDWAYEFEYAPYGVTSHLCLGVAATAADGTKVALERCGSVRTTWVADSGAAGNRGVPLISGSDTSVADPYVLTYPAGAVPSRMPTPQLTTWALLRHPNGSVFNAQLWSAGFGPLL